MAGGVSVVPGRGASVRCAACSPTHSQRSALPPPGEQSPSCRSTRGGTQRPGKTSPPHLDTDGQTDRQTDRRTDNRVWESNSQDVRAELKMVSIRAAITMTVSNLRDSTRSVTK